MQYVLITCLYITGAASALFGALLGFITAFSGFNPAFVLLTGLLFGYAYVCGLSLQHLRNGEIAPWTGVGWTLVSTGIAATAAFKYFRW